LRSQPQIARQEDIESAGGSIHLVVWKIAIQLAQLGPATLIDAAQCSVPVASFVPQLWLPEMRPFRSDPRFHEFAADRLRLLEYWEEYGPPDGYALRAGRLVDL
jgi:hypothetical protein